MGILLVVLLVRLCNAFAGRNAIGQVAGGLQRISIYLLNRVCAKTQDGLSFHSSRFSVKLLHRENQSGHRRNRQHNFESKLPMAEKFPSEMDMLGAIFDLVGALAHRLTGRVPSVKIKNGEGRFMWNFADINNVRWLNLPVQSLNAEECHDAAGLYEARSKKEIAPSDIHKEPAQNPLHQENQKSAEHPS